MPSPTSSLWLVALLALCCSCAFGVSAQGTVLSVLRNDTRFHDFVASIDNSAILTARLNNATITSTVFAPTNQNAAINMTEAQLAYHVVEGSHPADSLTNGLLVASLLQLPTLNNGMQQLKVSVVNETVYINGVRVEQANIRAENGLIHVLPSVLPLPGPLNQTLKGFTTFNSLCATANIVLPAGITVFVPDFASLQATNPALFGYLTSGVNGSHDDLAMVLKYHVLGSLVLYAQNIPEGTTSEPTLAGDSLTITKSLPVNGSAEVTLSSSSTSARVETVDTLASDGVLHTISTVLVPNAFVFTLRKILVGLNDTTLLSLLAQANLTHCLNENCNYTIFAPSEEAWQKADHSDYRTAEQLTTVLQSHIFPHKLPSLPQNVSLVMLNNKTVHIVNGTLTLDGYARLGAAHVIGNVAVGANGYVYAVDQVLGVALASDDSLSKAVIGWIIVGAMGGILLLAAIIVAVVWYVKRKRSDYEVINGSV